MKTILKAIRMRKTKLCGGAFLPNSLPPALKPWCSQSNSPMPVLRQAGVAGLPTLVWRTQDNTKAVEYDRELARCYWQRVKVKVLSLLPLDDAL